MKGKIIAASAALLMMTYMLTSGEVYRGADVCITAYAESDIHWSTSEDEPDTVVIWGEGPMPEWGEGEPLPWREDTSIKKVVIEEGVTSVSNDTFRFCSGIETVELPSTMETIGNSAFEGCTALKEINFPDGLMGIGAFAFGNTGLNSITLPVGVSEYGTHVFYNCTSLESVTLAEDMKMVPDSMFSDCESLSVIELPDELEEIGSYAFENCGFKKFKANKGLRKIGGSAFVDCEELVDFEFNDGLKTIGENAFESCHSLESAYLPDSLEELGAMAFLYSSKLREVRLPSSLKVIEGGTFFNCVSLEKIDIPKSVKSINSAAFRYCRDLKDITIDSDISRIEENVFDGTVWIDEMRKKDPLVVLGKCLIDGRKCTGSVVIPNGVVYISGYAFEDSRLTDVTVGNDVKAIGRRAFINCRDMKKAVIFDGVEDIEKNAFGYSNIDGQDYVINYPEDFRIKCFGGTAAEEYARGNDILYTLLENSVIGDVNDDGSIDIEDVANMMNHINGISPLTYDNMLSADVDGSGGIDIEDAVMLISYLNGNSII